jgi:P-type E1-E2 ATPase
MVPLVDDITEEDLTRYVTVSEVKSEHPIGKAIVNHSKSQNKDYGEPDSFEMIPGKGVKVSYNGEVILSGTTRFMEEYNIEIVDKCREELDLLRNEGKASIVVALNNRIIGVVGLSDVLRENAKAVVRTLKDDLETNVELLTGDNYKAANYFASKVGITDVHSELLPENKVEIVEKLKASDKKVCMVGDGVNDAPALKTANVSVAMGGMGTDIAIDAADMALLGDDIEKLPYLKKLSNATLFTIHLSITISMIINAIAIICSVLGLLNPITGALVHNVGSCAVVMLAASLYDRDFSKYVISS